MSKVTQLRDILIKLLQQFHADEQVQKRLDETAVLKAQQSAIQNDIKAKCEAYNKQQEQAGGGDILIAILDCNDPVAVAKVFPLEAKALDTVNNQITQLNTPPDLSALTQLILKIISSSKK